MEHTRARAILKSLAEGLDPVTGTAFPPDSPYQQADTVRALYAALDALSTPPAEPPDRPTVEPSDRQPVQPSRRPIDPNRPKLGQKWTADEDQQLRDAFTAQTPYPAIATAHGRSTGAITSRLVRLGLIQDDFNHPAHRPRQPTDRQTVPPASGADAPGSPPISDFRPPTSGTIAPPRNPKPDAALPF